MLRLLGRTWGACSLMGGTQGGSTAPYPYGLTDARRSAHAMEELWELSRYLEASDVAGALALLDEMEAIAQDDKIDRIASVIQMLLMHLIKQAAEQRTTKSWQASIRN